MCDFKYFLQSHEPKLINELFMIYTDRQTEFRISPNVWVQRKGAWQCYSQSTSLNHGEVVEILRCGARSDHVRVAYGSHPMRIKITPRAPQVDFRPAFDEPLVISCSCDSVLLFLLLRCHDLHITNGHR